MIIIKFFSSFCSSENCKDVIERLNQVNLIKEYGDLSECRIVITTENNYTHAIILNNAMPVLNIPKENVLGLAAEPRPFLNITPDFIEYATKYIGKYYIGNNINLPSPFINHYGFMWHTPIPTELKPNNKLMSIIFSTKNILFGHKYRNILVSEIINHNLPIDIYGNGCKLIQFNDSRIKGEFNDAEPYESYKFSIAIENIQEQDYISEKFTNCLIHKVTPLYYGAINVDKYFPKSFIRLTGEIENDLKRIKLVLSKPELFYIKSDYNKNLEQINLIKHLLNIF